MSHTDDRWTQGTAVPDLELFVGASEFIDTSAHATFASAGAGLFSLNLASTLAGTFFANLTAYFRKTGVYATPNLSQSQFGTAASVPGPTAVAGTSGPSALPPGMPPFTAAQLPTLAGPYSGIAGKGFQINSIDVIYTAATVNAALATVGVTKTKFVDNTAPLVTNIIALGANGLPVAFRALPNVKNVAVTTPAMVTDTDASVIANVNLTAGSGGTIVFYGISLKCSYNLN